MHPAEVMLLRYVKNISNSDLIELYLQECTLSATFQDLILEEIEARMNAGHPD
jgi:hypothetical protein